MWPAGWGCGVVKKVPSGSVMGYIGNMTFGFTGPVAYKPASSARYPPAELPDTAMRVASSRVPLLSPAAASSLGSSVALQAKQSLTSAAFIVSY